MVKKFTRLFIVENSKGEGNPFMQPSSSRSGFVVTLDEAERLSVVHKFGCAPTTEEVNTAMGRFLLEYQHINGPVAVFERRSCYRLVFYEGDSGCQDVYIEVDSGDGFPSRNKICHMSMCGKVNEDIHCFLYDFLDLCVAEEFLTIVDGCYHYNSSTDTNSDMIAKSVKPRRTDQEPGWTCPGERAKIVPLRGGVVRESSGADE